MDKIYKIHREKWKTQRNAMLLITLLTIVVVGLFSSVPILGSLAGVLIVGPVLTAATYKAYQSEAPFSVGLVLEKIKDNLTTEVISMHWSLTWRLFLWRLIPIYGLVKYYQYVRAFYIKLDNPEMSNIACIEKSKEEMNGLKMSYFIRRIVMAIPLYIALIALIILLVPLIIATAKSSSNLGTVGGLLGLFGTVGIFGLILPIISFYYAAKLKHFEYVFNDEMRR